MNQPLSPDVFAVPPTKRVSFVLSAYQTGLTAIYSVRVVRAQEDSRIPALP